MAGGLIIAFALITGLALPSFGINPTPTAPEQREVAGTQLAIQEGDLLDPGETAEYDTSPPTSGPSWAEAAAWGTHEEQAPDEAVVRNLRNGAVVFNYSLASEAQRTELEAFVEGAARLSGLLRGAAALRGRRGRDNAHGVGQDRHDDSERDRRHAQLRRGPPRRVLRLGQRRVMRFTARCYPSFPRKRESRTPGPQAGHGGNV